MSHDPVAHEAAMKSGEYLLLTAMMERIEAQDRFAEQVVETLKRLTASTDARGLDE